MATLSRLGGWRQQRGPAPSQACEPGLVGVGHLVDSVQGGCVCFQRFTEIFWTLDSVFRVQAEPQRVLLADWLCRRSAWSALGCHRKPRPACRMALKLLISLDHTGCDRRKEAERVGARIPAWDAATSLTPGGLPSVRDIEPGPGQVAPACFGDSSLRAGNPVRPGRNGVGMANTRRTSRNGTALIPRQLIALKAVTLSLSPSALERLPCTTKRANKPLPRGASRSSIEASEMEGW